MVFFSWVHSTHVNRRRKNPRAFTCVGNKDAKHYNQYYCWTICKPLLLILQLSGDN